MKWLVVAVAVVVVVLVALVAASWMLFSPAASRALSDSVESVGGTACEVEAVNLSPLRGGVAVEGFRVMNPPKFPDAVMFGFDRASVNVTVRSLVNPPVGVKLLRLKAPRLRVEASGLRSNLGVFLANVAASVREAKKAKPDAPAEKREPLRMIVDRVVITDAVVEIGPGLKTSQREVELGSFELTDLSGDDGRGVTAGELAAAVAGHMATRVVARLDLGRKVLLPEDEPGLLDRLLDGDKKPD